MQLIVFAPPFLFIIPKIFVKTEKDENNILKIFEIFGFLAFFRNINQLF